MANELVFLPYLDEDNYFAGLKACMKDSKGQLLLPDDVVQIPAPCDDPAKADAFYKFDREKKAWVTEKKPVTGEDCVALGPVSHQSQTDRNNELRRLYQKIAEENAETFRIVRGDNLEWIIEAIPPKMEEELAAEKLSQAKAVRSMSVSEITVEVDGMVFDGDEKAQNRMARVVVSALALGVDLDKETREWVMADDSRQNPTIRQLAKALDLATKKQGVLWPVPYETAT